jgi:DNA-binding transcriptional regulator YiaG
MDEVRTDGCGTAESCFNCGSSDVERAWRRQVFQYGDGESAVELTAEVPVYTCTSCGYKFAGPEAEDARHEAVCRHLGVLTPREIVAIRDHTGLSRTQFAERTRIGLASLKRWEAGILVQNAANDELMYLMGFPENVNRLQERDHHQPLNLSTLTNVPRRTPKRHSSATFRGRCIRASAELNRRANKWQLRASAE